MIVNTTKLDHELKSAGIPIDGVSSDGRIDFRPEATDAQRIQAQQILAAHDPTPLPDPKKATLDTIKTLKGKVWKQADQDAILAALEVLLT